MLLISWSLSTTFAPPKTTTIGLFGYSKKPAKNLIYFSMSKPAALILWVIPATLLWFLWAAPKASFTYIYPKRDN
jgi:hypothetical protein